MGDVTTYKPDARRAAGREVPLRGAVYRLLARCVALLLAAPVFSAAGAEPYPTRSIRLIVPFAAGGGTDIIGRILGQKLSESFGQQFVIDNRGGAGGTIGTALAAKAPADGYTLLLAPTSHVINPSIYPKLPYDTEKDFAPISLVAAAAILMAVHPSIGVDSMGGFVAAVKAKPETITSYGSAGNGTVFHLTGELFKQLASLTLTHVPYRGGGPTITALVAGEVPLAFETMLALQPHVRAGKLKALALASTRRSAVMPDVPTTAEGGFPQLVAENSYALFAPTGTPPEIIARLHAATANALGLAGVRELLAAQGTEVIGSTPTALAAYVASEMPKWAVLARQADVKPD
ncbi:MAG: tripartite tricarboxylate transporter substrate binding protein [Proteobacteria bacterium]|nr:tripartite tricarboxylate transporter substrate binding protein [Pseudomonadota bacterium]